MMGIQASPQGYPQQQQLMNGGMMGIQASPQGQPTSMPQQQMMGGGMMMQNTSAPPQQPPAQGAQTGFSTAFSGL